MTSNDLRSLVDTMFEKGFRNGDISQAEKTAGQSLNGHSDAVSKKYYQRLDREDDVAASRSAFQRLTPGAAIFDQETEHKTDSCDDR